MLHFVPSIFNLLVALRINGIDTASNATKMSNVYGDGQHRCPPLSLIRQFAVAFFSGLDVEIV
jgi:hypothetical protein